MSVGELRGDRGGSSAPVVADAESIICICCIVSTLHAGCILIGHKNERSKTQTDVEEMQMINDDCHVEEFQRLPVQI